MRNPDLGPLALYLARSHRSDVVFWLGFDTPAAAACFDDRVALVGIDRPGNAAMYRRRLGGTFLEHDFTFETFVPGAHALVDRSIVVCDDLLACPEFAERALLSVTIAVQRGATALITLPGAEPAELARRLQPYGLVPSFTGRTAADDATFAKTSALAIVEPPARRADVTTAPPDDFRAVAIVATFNEADVIEGCLRHAIGQGLDVYVMDNWSTDDTVARIAPFIGRGVIGFEQFPIHRTDRYDLGIVLARMEQLASTIEADWFVDYDSDEVRRSPFRDVDLRTALYAVDRAGYTACDFMVMNFRPVDDRFTPGAPLETAFDFFEFGRTKDHLRQRKAWKNVGRTPQLLESGGHDVMFPERTLYPYKFLNKHYPIRSQEHGERKVMRERRERYNKIERTLLGWHVHYDEWPQTENFLRDPGELLAFDPATFYETYLIERLTGIGVVRTPEYGRLVLDHHRESH